MPDFNESIDDVRSARALGRVEGRLSSLEECMDRVEVGFNTRLLGIEAKLDSLISTIAKASGGGWVAHRMLGVLWPALTGAAVYLVDHLWRMH